MYKLKLPKIYPVSCHTNNVGTHSVFVAIEGFKENGVKYINEAIKKGATKIVLNKNNKKQIQQTKNIEYVFVENTRKTLAKLAAQRLSNPASKLKIIGVTGTKGKTTTTCLINHILQQSGFKTATLGTIKNKINNQEIESNLTTPNSDFLHIFFDECVKQKIDFVIMEASAHALALHRIHGIKFDAIGFTNLQAEHLDFFSNMQKYFEAKCLIFNQIKNNGSIVINTKDEWGNKAFQKLAKNKKFKLFNLTQSNKNNPFKFKVKKNNMSGIEFELAINPEENIKLQNQNLFGLFNAYNISMAALICKQLGIETKKIKFAIKNFVGVPGRLQMYKLKNGAIAFVDYAHNPSSFESVLKTLKQFDKKLITVFGCGGDRDKTKRPMMGKLAEKYSNYVIITDDNPRNESRKKIVNEILTGIPQKNKSKIFCILNRKKAIEKAAKISDKNSIIAILGKGHENYYLVKNKKLYFDDFEEISNF